MINAEIERMRTDGVSDQELKDAKSYLTGSMPLSLSSTDRIAAILLSLQLQDLPQDYLDHYKDKINSVSKKDIKRVAERVLSTHNTTVIVGKPDETIEVTKTITTLPNVE